jgi:hypothetical protein
MAPPCSWSKNKPAKKKKKKNSCPFLADFVLGLVFNPGGGGDNLFLVAG